MLPTAPGALPIISHEFRADAAHMRAGRNGDVIRWLILHNSEGLDSRRYLTTQTGTGVSSHVLIRDLRYNLVDYSATAFHVGYAIPGVRNSNSLGVELENRNTNGRATYPYSDGQYNMLAHLLATWLFSYGLEYDSAVRCHRDVAIYPPDYPVVALRGHLGRRRDPSGLDLGRVRRETLAWLAFFRSLRPDQHAAWII